MIMKVASKLKKHGNTRKTHGVVFEMQGKRTLVQVTGKLERRRYGRKIRKDL